MIGGSGSKIQMMQLQDDSVTIIAAPVSGTKYEWRTGASGAGAALGTQKNVRILGISIILTWATTQPTPLEIHFTIDGIAFTGSFANPVTATSYYITLRSFTASAVLSTIDSLPSSPFIVEGKSVKVECAITWATTQPTNLTMRVKWAKIP